MIPSELGVCSIEGRIAMGFGLLDPIRQFPSLATHSISADHFASSEIIRYIGREGRLEVYPLR